MDSRDWLILKTVYKEKNITKAAKQLFISQPSLTYRIKKIEGEFHSKILIPEKRGIQFTTEGEFLVEYAKKMLLEEQSIKDKIVNMKSEIKGTLRIGASSSYAQYKLPPIFRTFLNNYPNVKIMLKTGSSSEIMNSLFNNEIHIGIENIGHGWQNGKILIGREKITIISKDNIKVSALPNHLMIEYTKNSFLKNLINNWWQKNFNVPPVTNIKVNYVEARKEMVKNGLGFSIVPEFCTKKNDNLNTIAILDENHKFITRNNWMNYKKSSLKIPIVKKFIDFIKKYNNI